MVLSLKLTVEQDQEIKKAAEYIGMTKSAFIRHSAILKSKEVMQHER